MKNMFAPFEKRKLSSKNLALLVEWKEIEELCNNHNDISYTIVKRNKDDLPIEYEVTYNIPSFVGLDKNKKIDDGKLEEKIEKRELFFPPLFGNIHRMQIIVPPNFPQVSGKPKGRIVSQIWHPNIVCHGDDNILGRVCFNEGNLDASVTIADRIVQVAEYLRYYNYLAEDREPHPYDTDVAYWIREIAEPMGWVVPEHGIIYEKFDIDDKEVVQPAVPDLKEKKTKKQKVTPKDAAEKSEEHKFEDDDILILDDETGKQSGSFSDDWIEYDKNNDNDENSDDDEILSI